MAARQYYSASNAGPVNNTSNSTWASVVTLAEFTPDVSSTYAVFWSTGLQNASNTSADADLQILFGPTGFETTKASLNLESANVSEYPQLAGMFFHVEDVAPIGVYCDVQIKAETNGNSINGKNGQIVALKLGANDVAAESLARQTTTSTTPTAAVTANFTSDGGDYVVIGYGEFDCNTASVPVYIRLTCDGVSTSQLGARTNDATNLTPGMMVWRFASVAAGARSASFDFRAHGVAQLSGITNARILVMRAADFDAVYGDQLTSDSAGTESSATAMTFTETLSANPHLLLGGWGTSSTTSGTNVTTDVTEAGSDIAESIRRSYNSAQVRFSNNAFASVRTPGSGSTTYTLDRSQSGSATIAVGAGSGLALLDLGSSGGGNDIAGTTSISVSPSAALTGKGAIAGTSSFSFTPTASLIGRGAVSGSTSFAITPTGSVVGVGTISTAATISIAAAGSVAGFGALAGQAQVSLTPTATLVGYGNVAGASSFSLSPAALLVGTGAVSGSAAISLSPVGSIAGLGSVAGSSSFALSPAANLYGLGDVSGSADIVFDVSGSLGGNDPISGSIGFSFSLTGTAIGYGDVAGAAPFSLDASGTLAPPPPSNDIAGEVSFGLSATGTLASYFNRQIANVIPPSGGPVVNQIALGGAVVNTSAQMGGPISNTVPSAGHIVDVSPPPGQLVNV